MLLRCTAVVVVLLCLSGCGGEDSSNSLTIPRGATISIRTTEAISTITHHAGDSFQGEINVPMRKEMTIYVPLLASVEGVVESVTIDQEGRNRISLRLTRLNLPGGETIALSTVPLVRQSKTELQTEDVTVRTGLDVDIDLLLGNAAESERRRNRETADPLDQLAIPSDSHLVFTLEEDITIPAP